MNAMSFRFQLYYITDRTQLSTLTLDAFIERAIAAGVDWVQIREKDLAARQLFGHIERAVQQARRLGFTRVMVNDRLDLALAAHADGVHLGTRSMAVDVVRRLSPPGLIVGASCHSLKEARAAELAGADYILLGPVFETPSKRQYGPPLGLGKLREITRQVAIPVLALGGISSDRVAACRENGAAGIAGIRLFQDSDAVTELVGDLREKAEK